MIITHFENLHRYDSLNPLFTKAFDWILSTDLASLKIGKIELEGKSLFANVQEYETRSVEESFFEAHRKYIDIQLLASGQEKIGWEKTEKLSEIEAYDSEKDFHKLSGKAAETVTIGGKTACILFPEDAHEPCLNATEGKKEKVKKICIKVAI